MSRRKLLFVAVVLFFGVKLVSGWLGDGGETTSDAPVVGDAVEAGAEATDGLLHVVEGVVVRNHGKVIYRGPIDLSATIARIRADETYPHRNDGSVFGNRERRLPIRQRGYYREYVHPTDRIAGPGPQRVVVGRGGDWWYTPDHYESFTALGTETGR